MKWKINNWNLTKDYFYTDTCCYETHSLFWVIQIIKTFEDGQNNLLIIQILIYGPEGHPKPLPEMNFR